MARAGRPNGLPLSSGEREETITSQAPGRATRKKRGRRAQFKQQSELVGREARAPAFPEALLVVSPEVAEAVAAGRPVVALETTVVTHGLPAQMGVQTAAETKKAGLIREGGPQ